MSVEFKFDYSEFERLSQNISKLKDKAEPELNKSLAKHGEEILMPKISNLIKASGNRRGGGIRSKVHAKHMKWHKIDKGNLEITIKSKGGAANKSGSLGYLVFPNEGRGKQNHVAQEFMERGTEQGTPELVDNMQEDLIKVIEEEL